MTNLLKRIEALEQRIAVREASVIQIASLLLQVEEIGRNAEARSDAQSAFMIEYRAWCLAGYGLADLIASSYHERGCQCAVCVPWSQEVQSLVAGHCLQFRHSR